MRFSQLQASSKRDLGIRKEETGQERSGEPGGPPVNTSPKSLARHFIQQDPYDPLRGPAVPPVRHPPLRQIAGEDSAGALQDPGRVVAHQEVGAQLAGDGAFGVVAHGDAGDPQHGGLLLQTAAVGKHQAGVHVQVQELQVTQGLGDPEPRDLVAAGEEVAEAELFGHLAGAGVDGEDDGKLAGDVVQRLQQATQHGGIVHIGGAVQGQGGESFRLKPTPVHKADGCGLFAVSEQGVDHHVADEVDLLFPYPFGQQVLVGEVIGGEEEVAEHVGAEAIDLLWHAHVAGAKTGLHMGHLNAQFLGGDGAGHGGVDIPHYDDQIGLFPQADLFEFDHDFGGLFGVGAGTDLQVDIRPGHAQVDEEGAAHLLVVVLAGVDQEMVNPFGIPVHGLDDRGHFHEVRASTNDVKYFQGHHQ